MKTKLCRRVDSTPEARTAYLQVWTCGHMTHVDCGHMTRHSSQTAVVKFVLVKFIHDRLFAKQGIPPRSYRERHFVMESDIPWIEGSYSAAVLDRDIVIETKVIVDSEKK